jgi:hypothetical protein
MAIGEPSMCVCVDGPMRGRLVSSAEPHFGAYGGPIMSSSRPVPQDPVKDINFMHLTYHVHQISFLGFGIRVASMNLDPSRINTYDVISCIFSEAGRQATYRVNGGE